ncbi:MAG: outer membrane protein assembly factor BamB [Gammaproteobacteria bacterium]|nr:outer membrane protein assembly factor BamB [Gammaproteobacteria bacterium]MDH5776685.1 outer membrane protein assembly factor BamB [Gammaproteobacteria bacterium]
MRLTLHTLFMMVLAGCSTSPSPILPPEKLTELDNKLSIKLLWQRTVGNGASDNYLKLKPAISGKTGYAIDHQGYLLAWDLHSGKKLWSKKYNTPASSALSLTQDRLYFGTSLGEVITVNRKNGQLIWRAQVSSEVLSAPVIDGNAVVVRTVDGRIHSLSATNGQKLWVYDRSVPVLSLRGTSSPIVVDGLVISGADNGKLTALSLKTGAVLWETTIAVPSGRSEIERLIDIDAQPLIRDGVIYAVAFQGRLAAVRIDSGRILWVRDISSYNGMTMDTNRLYLSDSEGKVWALDRFNGATLWKQERLLRRAISRPVIQGSNILVGDFNGYLHWMSRTDGRLLARTRLGQDPLPDIEEDEEADSMIFSQSRNILATPVVRNDIAIVIDRKGLLSAFRVSESI